MKYYTVYKDEDIVAFGTSAQCTKMLNLKNIRQFYALISKSRSGLRRRYSVVVEDVDDEKENIQQKHNTQNIAPKLIGTYQAQYTSTLYP